MRTVLSLYAALAVACIAASPDAITRLVSRLSSDGFWTNGVCVPLNLPVTAKGPQLVTALFEREGPATIRSIIEVREVRIRGPLPDFYTAVRVDTDLGERVALFHWDGPGRGWWSRVYDLRPKA